MPPLRYRDFGHGSILPATYTDALEDLLSGFLSSTFQVVLSGGTALQVSAGGDIGSVGVSIGGDWRHIEATQTRSMPGGVSGWYDVWVVASANSFAAGGVGVGEIDNTFYGFELRILAAGAAAPTGTLAGGQSIALTRKVRQAYWDGAVVTHVRPLAYETPVNHAASHAPDGYDPLPVDQAVGVGSLRTLGAGATQAAPGNDARLSDQRTPVDASVTAAKVAASLKPSGTAAAGTESLRALGNAAGQAAPGLSPVFAGTPTAPTAAPGTSTSQLATTAFVTGSSLYFRAYRSSAALLLSGGTVLFNAETDPNGWYDPATGLFQPTVAGIYRLSWGVVLVSPLTASKYMTTQLSMSSGETALGGIAFQSSNARGLASMGSTLVAFNGTTDSASIQVLHDNGGSVDLSSTGRVTHFEAERIGA